MKKLTLLTTALIVSFTMVHNRADAQDFVYLMPSKEIAETGEDFFFKAYQLDRQTLALSDRSRTLYRQRGLERKIPIGFGTEQRTYFNRYRMASG